MKRGPNDGRWQLRLDFGGGVPSVADAPRAKVPQEGGTNFVRVFTDDPAVPLIGSGRATLKSSPVTIASVTTRTGTPIDDAASAPKTEAIRRRSPARLPVPEPLPEAVAAGHFGRHEDGRPVRPSREEVREITECHADTLRNLLLGRHDAIAEQRDGFTAAFEKGIVDYAESFGAPAADRLRAHVQRLACGGKDGGRTR